MPRRPCGWGRLDSKYFKINKERRYDTDAIPDDRGRVGVHRFITVTGCNKDDGNCKMGIDDGFWNYWFRVD